MSNKKARRHGRPTSKPGAPAKSAPATATGSDSQKPEASGSSAWFKVGVWFAGILGSVLLLIVTDAYPMVKNWVTDLTRSGPELQVASVENLTPSVQVVVPGVLGTDDRQRLGQYPNLDFAGFVQHLKAQRGGFYVGSLIVKIGLQGRRHQAADVTNIEVVDLHRQAPLGGTLVQTPSQGTTDSARMVFDLDAGAPVAREVTESSGQPGGLFFAKTGAFTLQDSNGPDYVTVYATTDRHAASFRIRITYRIGGKTKHLTVNDTDGQPFRLTAFNCRNHHPVYTDAWIQSTIGQTDAVRETTDPTKIGGC